MAASATACCLRESKRGKDRTAGIGQCTIYSVLADAWVEEGVRVDAAHDLEHQLVVKVRAGELSVDVAVAWIRIPDHVRATESSAGRRAPLAARRVVRVAAAKGVLKRLARC